MLVRQLPNIGKRTAFKNGCIRKNPRDSRAQRLAIERVIVSDYNLHSGTPKAARSAYSPA
jgi:hypothetical protein